MRPQTFHILPAFVGGRLSRRGVTLIELLVVITILLTITAAAIPILAPAVQSRRVREAARLVSSYLMAARARATATGRQVGVMIERYPPLLSNSSFVSTETMVRPYSMNLSIAEAPPPYAGDSIVSTVTLTRVTNSNSNQVYVNFTDSSWMSQRIRIGDAIRFNGRGPLYYFDLSNTQATNGYITATSPWTASLLDSPLGMTTYDLPYYTLPLIVPPGPGTPGVPVTFEVFRQPVRSPVDPLQLPEGIVIDLVWSGMATETNGIFAQITTSGTPPNPVITFAPTGSVAMLYDTSPASVNTSGPLQPTGPIYLLLGRPDQIPIPPSTVAPTTYNNLGDPNSIWISIAPQTGTVGVNPNYTPYLYSTPPVYQPTDVVSARKIAAGAALNSGVQAPVTNVGGN